MHSAITLTIHACIHAVRLGVTPFYKSHSKPWFLNWTSTASR